MRQPQGGWLRKRALSCRKSGRLTGGIVLSSLKLLLRIYFWLKKGTIVWFILGMIGMKVRMKKILKTNLDLIILF